MEKESTSASPFEDVSKNGESISNQTLHFFTSFDYGLFGLMLLLSAAIGIYFGFFAKRKQNTTTEYLLGGKKMNFFPIAASLIASHVNGFTMLAVPAEVYAHGSEYSLCVISAILVSAELHFVALEKGCDGLMFILDGRCFDLCLSASILRPSANVIIPVSREEIQSDRSPCS